MARHHPRLTGTFARLAGEHRAIARVQDELAALLAAVRVADPARCRTELERMSVELNAHLDDEEERLLPLLAEVPWPPHAPAPADPAASGDSADTVAPPSEPTEPHVNG
ncbi:hemerythrin domain-containing protein [Streptomyces sp. NPDC047985]|uniref:hemerythrin domain-containing protein n=1 Tax=Streptomyces sp. NPDC047985 TaxID=3155384 RepID=UPI00342E2653